jgi:TonB family protein
VQPPLEFNVVVTFRPGSEPEVLQSGAPIAVASSRDFAGPALIPDALAEGQRADIYLRERLAEVTRKLREIERTYRIETEGRQPGDPVLDVLLRDLAVLSDQTQMLLERLRTSSATSPEQLSFAQQDLERARRAAQEAARRLAQSSRVPEQTVAAEVRPTPTSPFDGSPQLRSPSGRAPVRVGGSVPGPRVIKSPKPEYTAEAMKARIQGTVAIEALIDEQGRVADARVLSSIPQLDESALAAARQWEFTPTLLNGQPVPVLVVIELEFNLRK